MSTNIAITGEGIISAIGNDKSTVLQSLREKRTGIGKITHLQTTLKDYPVGEVKLSNTMLKQKLGISNDTIISRTTLMGIWAVRQALEDAGLDSHAAADGTLRIVLISGTTVGGMDLTEKYFSEIVTNHKYFELLNHHEAGSTTKEIASYFNLFTDYTTISTACSSAANSILLGANLIKAGEADIVVAGGAESLSAFHLNGFHSLMILDHDTCRPFDKTHNGLNLGEGAAYLVLESEQSARKRRVPIHAYLTGYGNACDAYHQTATSENGEGAYLAMREALEMSGLTPDQIQYVNAHGTGTVNNDETETTALQRIFTHTMPHISSTKSLTAHTTSASGGIESIISILALQEQFIPPNMGWTTRMRNGITPSQGKTHADLKNVMCNSFGFGGNDTTLIFSSSAPIAKEAPSPLHQAIKDTDIVVKSKVEITDDTMLDAVKRYVTPLEYRRMGKLMKASLLTSLRALEEAGLDKPDAIIIGTEFGSLENSETLLRQLIHEAHPTFKPTLFMQSTHNTITSNVAIKLKCHGYNMTYSQGKDSLRWCIRDARMLLKSGKCKNVLVGYNDESTEIFRHIADTKLPNIHSISIVLSCGK